jgi:hypothetical protein
MPYTITDQREYLLKNRPEDVEGYGFVLKYWHEGLESCPTYITFASQEEAEEYLILNKLGGTLV